MRLIFTFLIILICPGFILYKLDIQQGNEITHEMITTLKIGMTKREVTQLMGFPLINDPFHKDRFDYFYSKKTGKTGKILRHSASLIFLNNQLIEIHTEYIND